MRMNLAGTGYENPQGEWSVVGVLEEYAVDRRRVTPLDEVPSHSAMLARQQGSRLGEAPLQYARSAPARRPCGYLKLSTQYEI